MRIKQYKNILLLALLFPMTSVMAAEKYTLDPTHSFVVWHISHFDFSHPTGKWFAEGDIEFDPQNIKNSKIDVTIPVEKMVTGIEKLDTHLMGKEFFDTKKYPTATFVSEKIESSDNKNAKVYGTLTLHGVSQPVVLDATLNKTGLSPVNNKETIGFSAHTKIKRSDFGINAYLPGLGDEVNIDIEVEANKNK